MRPIHTIVFHCSASDTPAHDDVSVMTQWHKQRGFTTVGYHFFIKKDGTIQTGRPLDQVGAHVAGHNTGTVGVCFHGLNDFTQAQMKSIHTIIKQLEQTVGFPLKLTSHRDYTKAKTCPNFYLDKFLKGELQLVKKYTVGAVVFDQLSQEVVCDLDRSDL